MATQPKATGDSKQGTTPRHNDWTKPAAMAIPKEGFFKKGRRAVRADLPQDPACYGFSVIAKIIPGREPVFYEYAKNIEKAVADAAGRLAVLKLTTCGGYYFRLKAKRTSCTRAFSTPTSTSTPKTQSVSVHTDWASARYSKTLKDSRKTGRLTPPALSSFS